MQSTLQQKSQPTGDLLEGFFSDQRLSRIQLKRFEKLSRFLNTQRANFGKAEFFRQFSFRELPTRGCQFDVACLLVESFAVARRTADDFQMLFHRATQHWIFCGAIVFQLAIDPAFPSATVLVNATAGTPRKGNVPIPRPEQPQSLRLFRKIHPLRFEHGLVVHADNLFDGLRCACQNVTWPATDLLQRGKEQRGAILNGLLFINDDGFVGKSVSHAKTVTVDAHSQRTVEAEKLRRRRLVTHPAFCARIIRAVHAFLLSRLMCACATVFVGVTFRRRTDFFSVVLRRADQSAVGQLERLLDGFRQPPTTSGACDQSVDDNFNVVLVMSPQS